MIIGVEGNVHSGKTTYINNFLKNNSNFFAVPECKFDENLSDYDRQLYYLQQERAKRVNYKQDNLIMDRTILSTLCYTAFCKELTNEERKELLNVIYSDITDNKYLLFDKLLYVRCDWGIVKDNHIELRLEKNTQDILAENSYLDFYNNTFEEWFKGVTVLEKIKLGDRLITEYNGREIWDNVIAWLKERLCSIYI